MTYRTYLCGPSDCPTDPGFEHDNYFGCVPKDFKERTGRSATFRQKKGADGRYRWNGGCDPSNPSDPVLKAQLKAQADR